MNNLFFHPALLKYDVGKFLFCINWSPNKWNSFNFPKISGLSKANHVKLMYDVYFVVFY